MAEPDGVQTCTVSARSESAGGPSQTRGAACSGAVGAKPIDCVAAKAGLEERCRTRRASHRSFMPAIPRKRPRQYGTVPR
ncbi:hypothetical protein D3C72_1768910 [compost metagenome]